MLTIYRQTQPHPEQHHILHSFILQSNEPCYDLRINIKVWLPALFCFVILFLVLPTPATASRASPLPHGEGRVWSTEYTTAEPLHWILQSNQRAVFSHVICCCPQTPI